MPPTLAPVLCSEDEYEWQRQLVARTRLVLADSARLLEELRQAVSLTWEAIQDLRDLLAKTPETK